MYINKPIYLFLGIIAAASVVTAGGFAPPALASTGGGYDEKYLRCYEYSEKSNEHTDADYSFKYKNFWYYCWDYDNNNGNGGNGGGY